MSSIRDRITSEIKTAMKARNQTRLSTLRMIKSEILKKETSSGAGDVDEAGLIALLQSMKKQRLDSITQFRKGGRDDLAAVEEAEIGVIETFLPSQFTDEELASLVKDTATELGIDNMKGMGQVIRTVKEKAAGRADGKRISNAVKAHLSNG